MKVKHTATWYAATFALALVVAPAHARDRDMDRGGAMKEHAEAMHARVLSGGVGLGSRDQLEQRAHGYDLKLVFAARSGAYLADVPVRVTDRHGGVVVSEVSQGPWMFIDLPPGSYTVEATLDGKTQRHHVALAGHARHTVEFRWSDRRGDFAMR